MVFSILYSVGGVASNSVVALAVFSICHSNLITLVADIPSNTQAADPIYRIQDFPWIRSSATSVHCTDSGIQYIRSSLDPDVAYLFHRQELFRKNS
jgi:hypothetical protein